MVSLPKTRWMHTAVWLGWCLALLLLAGADPLPVNPLEQRGGSSRLAAAGQCRDT